MRPNDGILKQSAGGRGGGTTHLRASEKSPVFHTCGVFVFQLFRGTKAVLGSGRPCLPKNRYHAVF